MFTMIEQKHGVQSRTELSFLTLAINSSTTSYTILTYMFYSSLLILVI